MTDRIGTYDNPSNGDYDEEDDAPQYSYEPNGHSDETDPEKWEEGAW